MKTNNHTVIRVDDLLYKGCEPHWKCTKCGICVPFHCYSKKKLEEMECKQKTNLSTSRKL